MPTLETVLETASQLPPEQQEMLAEIIRQRQNDAWRRQTAEEARQSLAAFREGKLKAEPSNEVIAQLRKSLDSASDQ